MTVTLAGEIDDVGVCHCGMCRRWCSGPWMGLQVPATAKIEGATVTIYRSSMFAERGFCGVCGTNIFYRMQDGPELEVSAGLFDSAGMHLSREIFHDSKPTFYAFGGDAIKRTGASMKLEYAPRLIARRFRKIVRHLLRARARFGLD